MAYTANIPQATDRIKDSQSQLLGNFQAIKALVDVNHVTFDLAGQGKHKFVTFPTQAAAIPTILDTESCLFYGTSADNGATELQIKKDAAGVPVSFTGAKLSNDSGWTRLPSGLLLKFDVQEHSGMYTHTWQLVGCPAFQHVYCAYCTNVPRSGASEDSYSQLISFDLTTIKVNSTLMSNLATPFLCKYYVLVIGD